MKFRIGLVALLIAIACVPAPLLAQYMYLDANGDGVSTAADALLANGSPTVADVYLDTDSNRDGTAAACNTSDALLDINSYVFNLRAVGGVVSYTSPINRISQFTIAMVPDGFVANGYRLHDRVGYFLSVASRAIPSRHGDHHRIGGEPVDFRRPHDFGQFHRLRDLLRGE